MGTGKKYNELQTNIKAYNSSLAFASMVLAGEE